MQRPIALMVFGSLLLVQAQTAPKPKYLPIVFDDWWNVDYVKNGCQMQASEAKRGNPYARPCPADSPPADIVKEFEDELEVAFASESVCHGLSLLHFTPEMAQAAAKETPNAPARGVMAKMAGPDWSLMLDLSGSTRTQKGQGWTLVGPQHEAFNGRITTPQRLVQQICKIAKGVGGQKEN
jgi:hypothetical protein